MTVDRQSERNLGEKQGYEYSCFRNNPNETYAGGGIFEVGVYLLQILISRFPDVVEDVDTPRDVFKTVVGLKRNFLEHAAQVDNAREFALVCRRSLLKWF